MKAAEREKRQVAAGREPGADVKPTGHEDEPGGAVAAVAAARAAAVLEPGQDRPVRLVGARGLAAVAALVLVVA
ncbi:hypothetical protein BU198_09135, partial [Streptomyces sp. CBMA156]|nr:hypothetical protein [Streptomyces sp. CBMA156]